MEITVSVQPLSSQTVHHPTTIVQAVVTAIAGRLDSEESIADQVEILVGGLCPGTSDPETCIAELPGSWHNIAHVLWPGYYNSAPDVS
jgi:hypothetical protein